MKQVTIMIGNIGSGKSTLVKKIKENSIVVSRDSLRYGIGAGDYIFNTYYEPAIWRIEKYSYEEFLKLGVNIIVDETNMNKKSRSKYIRLAKQYGYDVHAVVFPTLSKKLSVDRRMDDPHGQPDRTVWEGVWERFNNSYQAPTLEEGFDAILKVEGDYKIGA